MTVGRRTDYDHLTKTEIVELEAMGRGLSVNEAAKERFVEPQTVKFHRTKLYRKLGARNSLHALAIAYREGYLERPILKECPTCHGLGVIKKEGQ